MAKYHDTSIIIRNVGFSIPIGAGSAQHKLCPLLRRRQLRRPLLFGHDCQPGNRPSRDTGQGRGYLLSRHRSALLLQDLPIPDPSLLRVLDHHPDLRPQHRRPLRRRQRGLVRVRDRERELGRLALVGRRAPPPRPPLPPAPRPLQGHGEQPGDLCGINSTPPAKLEPACEPVRFLSARSPDRSRISQAI